jgi:diketogulonate reductase-like aldo/keto reductase
MQASDAILPLLCPLPTRRPSLFTIPKAATPQHVAENAGAAKIRLTDEEIARIEIAFPVERVPQALSML